MQCSDVRQLLLDLDWTAVQRREVADALAHLERCADCRNAMEEFERVAEILKPVAQSPTPRGGWQAFEERLLDDAPLPHQRGRRILPQLARLAAAFLLGVIVIEAYRAVSSKPTPIPPRDVAMNTNTNTNAVPFTPEEVVHNVKAFDEVSQAFDRRASWVMFAKDTSDVGLSDQPVAQQEPKRLLLLRLTMSRGGDVISSSDLMIVAGQTASLTVPLTQGQSLRYEIGTTIGKPPRLSLWAELRTPRGDVGETIGALATQLQLEPNQKISAGEFVTSSGAYRLKIAFSEASYGGGGGSKL
jgi:hypothetical protein